VTGRIEYDEGGAKKCCLSQMKERKGKRERKEREREKVFERDRESK